MNYVLIRNGSIVSSKGTRVSDLLIGNNKIIEIARNISRPDPETPVIDASGKYILPGAIDTNRTFSEFGGVLKDEMLKLCRAQIIGGTTCMLETLEPKSKMSCSKGIYLFKDRSKKSIIDYGFHLSMGEWEGFSEKDLDYCFAHEGITTFYVKNLHDQIELISGHGKVIEKIKELNLCLLIEINYPEPGGSGYTGMEQSYDEMISIHLEHLKLVLDKVVETGCKACFLNVGFQEELDLILEAQKSHKIYAELTMPCYIGEGTDFVVSDKTIMNGFQLADKLSLIPYSTFWSLLKNDLFMVARPSLRVANVDDTVDRQVFNRPDEYFVLKNALSVLYTSGVSRNSISVEEFVNLISEKPAKIMGLYPQKGVLMPGSDADVIVWDPDTERNLYCSYPRSLKIKIKPTKLKGKAQFVFVKGVLAYDGEVFYGENLTGRFLYRNTANY